MALYILICSLALILHSYILYPLSLILFRSMRIRRPSGDVDRESQLSVSIVISVFNEEKIIRQRIENLLALEKQHGRLEILIGSDCSTDATNSIIGEYRNKGVTLIAFEERRGKACVLNDIVAAAKNDIIVFSDANTFYDADVVLKFSRHFSDGTIGGVCGYLQLRTTENNSGGKGESFYWEYENRIKEYEGDIFTTFGATGAIYAIRRNLFVPLPTDRVIMDDFIIPMRIVDQGYRVKYDRAICGWEDATSSALTEFQRKIRIGAANFHSLSMIYHMLNPKRGFVSFGLFSHKIIRWFSPFLLLLFFFASVAEGTNSEFTTGLLLIQIIFIGLALVGLILDRLSFPVKIFTFPYYFILANLGLLIGFYRFLTGTQKAAWSATR